jgi:rod shape-determining protein MreB and related proteins
MGVFSDDIAIDLGTANTLVHVPGRGIVIDEPSVVAIQTRNASRQVIAVGERAKLMVGRTPDGIKPMRDGVIADFVATEAMLRHFIGRAKSAFGFRRPRIIICVPAGATPVERRAVYETAVSAGGRKVYLIEEPVAAALGAGLPVKEPTGSMVVDIGGGTTDIAVLSLGGVLEAKSIKTAGHKMDEHIIRFIRREHQLLVGEGNAERIKIEVGTADAKVDTNVNGSAVEIRISGRDLRNGRTKSIILGPPDIARALDSPIEDIAEAIQRTLERLPPEVASDIAERGICLTGGGALLRSLDAELQRRTGSKFFIADNPTQCVIKGTGLVLEKLSEHEAFVIMP